jgi:hypothetical protein
MFHSWPIAMFASKTKSSLLVFAKNHWLFRWLLEKSARSSTRFIHPLDDTEIVKFNA